MEVKMYIYLKYLLSPCLFNLYGDYIMQSVTSWNQDFWEKYQ